jgi:hypothetical protein
MRDNDSLLTRSRTVPFTRTNRRLDTRFRSRTGILRCAPWSRRAYSFMHPVVDELLIKIPGKVEADQ